jgi:hypothetical protein
MQVFSDDVFGENQEAEEEANINQQEGPAITHLLLKEKQNRTEEDGINDQRVGYKNNLLGVFIGSPVAIQFGNRSREIPQDKGEKHQ